jgi:predicted Fe-Mo cluster-binding NifX family protein
MKACFPVAQDRGLDSPVHPNFGSAPMFLIVDTATKSTRAIASPELDGPQERCRSFTALAGEKIDMVIASGIGAGALERLRAAQIPAYRTAQPTARAALRAIGGGSLPPVLAEAKASCAGGAGGGGGCAGHAHQDGSGAAHKCRGGCGGG